MHFYYLVGIFCKIRPLPLEVLKVGRICLLLI